MCEPELGTRVYGTYQFFLVWLVLDCLFIFFCIIFHDILPQSLNYEEIDNLLRIEGAFCCKTMNQTTDQMYPFFVNRIAQKHQLRVDTNVDDQV